MKNLNKKDIARKVLKDTKALAYQVKNNVTTCRCEGTQMSKLTAEGRKCTNCSKSI